VNILINMTNKRKLYWYFVAFPTYLPLVHMDKK